MVEENKVKKVEDKKEQGAEISKEDIIKEYMLDNESYPTWKDKKQKDMDEDEKNEYKKYRGRIKKVRDAEKKIEQEETITDTKITKEEQEGFYDVEEENVSEEDMTKLLTSTIEDMERDMLPDDQKSELDKLDKENKFIEDYIKHHEIDTQEKLNYVIEHDEKFRLFLDKTDRLSSLYTGRHLKEIESEKEKVLEQLKEDAKKDKGNKIVKRWERGKKKKKKQSNIFNESKKDLDLTPYKNKKLESQGSILTMYLRKNGLAQLRYVRMDEVGQIKVEGYVYHERDAVYRFGKKNDPLLIIMEGALVPINKETLKENLGCTTAEAQKLVIKGIEQAEVVKSSGLDENAKKPFTPNKWLVGAGIAVIIGIYAFMGGFS